MAGDESFLSRWSRLKQENRTADKPEDKSAEVSLSQASIAPSGQEARSPAEQVESPLPPIESLTKDSDFTAFMKLGVPDDLRNKALRKLWEADPSLYAHDGLTDYGADYAKIMRDGESLAATAYKVGRGFLEKGELPWEKEEESHPAPSNSTATAKPELGRQQAVSDQLPLAESRTDQAPKESSAYSEAIVTNETASPTEPEIRPGGKGSVKLR